MNKYIIFAITFVLAVMGVSQYTLTVHAEEGDSIVPNAVGSNISETGPSTEGTNAPEGQSIVPDTQSGNADDSGAIVPGAGNSNANDSGPIIPSTGGSNSDEITSQTTPSGDNGNGGSGGEVTPANGGGSGGSSSSSSGSSPRYLTTPVATAIVGTSCPLITDYLKIGGTNDQSQVTKLQIFLKNVEKLDVDVTSIFDTKTEAAVKSFQTKYLSSILGPWNATRATGFVYITTLKKINEIACATAFTLNADEQAIIDAYKQRGESTQPSVEVTPQTQTPASGTPEVGSNDNTGTTENAAAVGQSSILSRFWNFITDLFR